jgi:topoisomerase-4 subunit A
VDASALQFKAGDGLLATFACRSVETLLVFGTAAKGSGRVYSVAVSSLPGGRGDGVPVTSLIDLEPAPSRRTTLPARPMPRCCWPAAPASA